LFIAFFVPLSLYLSVAFYIISFSDWQQKRKCKQKIRLRARLRARLL
jgi:hypothetical protein